ncbi:hypothetical protein [Bradyrhizobium sp. STM 3562]|uniref:hypothetical protein n=1 Tax=Bradyrhizobium sp. STM 3562 TaxID=578924 RepID=UPI00388CFADA
MQSAACLEWERPRRKPASLLAFAAWCSITLTIVSPACVAQDAFPRSSNRFDNATPVYLVDQTACEAKVDPNWGWSDEEKWAWSQICQHLPVDFDERDANDCANQQAKDAPDRDTIYKNKLSTLRNKSPRELANEPSRRLSANFLSKVFGEPKLRPHTWTEQLRFAGFNTDILVIDTALLKSLDLRHAHVGRLSIQNAAVDGGVRLENVYSGSININLVTAKNILLSSVSVSENNSEQISRSESVPGVDKRDCGMTTIGAVRGSNRERENLITQPKQPSSNNVEHDGELVIDTVRIDDRLAILEGDYGAMNFTHVKVDDLFIFQPKWTGAKNGTTPDLSIIESVDNGVFTLQVNEKSLPKRIKLNQFIFANAYLGSNPMPVVTALDVDTKSPDLEPYTLIAKSYTERGEKRISDDVLIAMNERNRDLARTQSLADFAQLTFLRYLVNYGFSPEIGFVYILLFVLLGWAIFWCASGRLEAGAYQPKTPFATFLLALDSVIPGIQLDKNNLEVRYKGWPQKMLYLLRALGAILVAVAYSFLQKRLYG